MTFTEEYESIKAAAREWGRRDARRQLNLARVMIDFYSTFNDINSQLLNPQQSQAGLASVGRDGCKAIPPEQQEFGPGKGEPCSLS